MSHFYEHAIIPAVLRRTYDVYDRIRQLGMDLGTFEAQVHSLKGRNICSAIFHFWFTYWKWTLLLNMSLGFLTVIWFSLGGLADVRDIMRRLALLQRDDADDGRVEAGSRA